MANNLASNFNTQLAKGFLKAFEANRVASKNVNTQLLKGKFNPASGTTVEFKKPHDYKVIRTSDGDISLSTKSDIIAGKTEGTVQDYFTTAVNFDEVDEALKLDELDKILNPLGRRIVIDFEVDFADYMMKRANLYAGTIGNGVNAWSEVAEAAAVMESVGVPQDEDWFYGLNPFSCKDLASAQLSLGSGGVSGGLIKTAWEKAMISQNLAGLNVMKMTTMSSVTTQAGADRAGTLSSNPTVTYVAHKDTWIQTLPVTAFQANLVVKAGERITIAGRYYINQATRTVMLDETGAKVLWSAVVAADVTLDGSGAGNITVYGPAIYEASGAYNTVDSAPISGDVITLLGSASTTYQPNLFWHRNAYGIGSCDIKKLYSTDTLATMKDGLKFRVSKYADGDANSQSVRFDFHPAYAVFNPFWAGHGYGTA